jgi:flotillin
MFQSFFAANVGWIVGAVLLFLAALGSVRYAASRYKKVPPSKVGVVYGRKNTITVQTTEGAKQEVIGFRLLTGGGKVIWPIVEEYNEMELGVRGIEFDVEDIPTADGVRVTVSGIAALRIGHDQDSLIAAARNFGDKTDSQIDALLQRLMSGQLRAILGKMKVEQLIQERDQLNKQVLEVAEADMAKLGIKIDLLAIQNITDKLGYIDSLGKKRTAEVKRDADIGVANAQREALEQTSEANKAGQTAKLDSEALIAEAQRNLDTKKAGYNAEVAKARATAEQAGPLAEAEALKGVKLAQVAVETAETQARIGLAEQNAARVEKELVSTTIKPAEAAKTALLIAAEGAKSKLVIEANANAEAAEKQASATRVKAEAERDATTAKGVGEAAATQARLLADAAGTEANLKATAAGTEANLMAQAKVKEAGLLAEAKGKLQLAEALAKLDETGRLLQILDAAPVVLQAAGAALAQALGTDGLAQVFKAIAEPMGNIDSIQVVDFGGNGQNGGPLGKFTAIGPDVVFGLLAKAKALGFGPLLEKIGLTSAVLDGVFAHTEIQNTNNATKMEK